VFDGYEEWHSAVLGWWMKNGVNGLGEMAREERSDAASRISRVLAFVTRPQDDTEHPDQALVIVEERVPGVRVLFDIMVDLTPLECTFQPRSRAL
jgi:hypothetical protein